MLHRFLKWKIEIAIFFAVLLSRVVIMPKAPAEWDSVQLALGLTSFDIRVHSPHPPGYWLYVACGRFVHWLTPLDPSQSLTLVSALGMSAAGVVAWRVALHCGSRAIAGAFTLLIVSNPFVWFYGLTPNVYAFDLLCALILMNFALKEKPSAKDVVLIALTIGLMAGLRQSVVYIFGPLALYVVIRARPSLKTLLVSVGVGIAAVLVWLIPASFDQAGGLRVLYESTSSMWKGAAKNTSILAGAPSEGVRENIGKATATPIVAFLLIGLAMVLLAALGVALKHWNGRQKLPVPQQRTAWIVTLLIVPSLLVTTLGHFGKPGYILSYMPAIVLMGCLAVRALPKKAEILGVIGLVLISGIWSNQFLYGTGMLPNRLINSGPWFFSEAYGVPFKTFTYDTISIYERDMAQYSALVEVAKPNDTVVYLGAEGIERFRKMSYKLPDFTHELVQDGDIACTFAYQLRMVDCHAQPIRAYKVRPGGRALFTANAPNADIVRLVQEGKAVALPLSTGPTVFAVEPGAVVQGLPVIEDPNLAQALKAAYS